MNKQEIEDSIRKCYSTWGTTYYDEYYGPNAPYPPVHRDLLKRVIKSYSPATLLDAGCGPASFLREIFDQPVELFGFDLTPEMVNEGKRIMAASGRKAEHLWTGSVLEQQDFQNPARSSPASYDGTVCMGVLPHISPDADLPVLKNLHAALKTGGFAIVEARNQLFSLFTMNRYSYEFMQEQLVRPEQLRKKLNTDQNAEFSQCLEEMKAQFRMDLPPIRKGKKEEPGYDEVLSRTHNPFVLREQFAKVGFKNIRTLFYHFHALPPMFGQKSKSFFLKESIAMESDPEDWRGHFMASAFLLLGERA